MIITVNYRCDDSGYTPSTFFQTTGKQLSKGVNIVKILKVFDLLCSFRGTTATQISEELEIDRTNVYTWLRIIENELGFPIIREKDQVTNQTRMKLDKEFYQKMGPLNLPDIKLTPQELIALFMLKGEAGAIYDSNLADNIDSAYSKIAAFAPKGMDKKLGKLQSLFLLNSKMAKSYKGKEEIIDQLTNAMLDNQTCYVSYHSFYDDKDKNFKIDPLHFFEHQGGLYIFVNATSFDDIRILAVERISKVEASGETFTYPSYFDPVARQKQAFGLVSDEPLDVEIWFSEHQARYIRERVWAEDQEIVEQDDGSIVLKMRTSGSFEIKKWVLGYGADAEILRPENLRKEIKCNISQLNAIYKISIHFAE